MGFKEKMMNGMMDKMSAEEIREMMDSMMEGFFSKMSGEEKQSMMNAMMEKFFSTMSQEEKNNMMQDMMTKMMGDSKSNPMGGMMGMMSSMMGGKGGSMMDMCKNMMGAFQETANTGKFSTTELRNLFEEWSAQIEEEIYEFIKKSGDIIPEKLAEHFKLSKESIIYFLKKLAEKGKIHFVQ